MTDSERWERIVALLTGHGVEARLVERPWSGSQAGHVLHGVSRSIIVRHPAGGVVDVHDRWWSKNAATWIGYAVTREDREGIVVRDYPVTKDRYQVVHDVLEALAAVPAVAS